MECLKLRGSYTARCIGPDGREKWKAEAKNLIVNAGLNHILNTVLHGGTPVATWYLGLKNAGAVVAADTLAVHSGWAENVNYTGDRKEFIEAAASAQAITNSANVASFPITADGQVISGALLASVSTGTSGVLMSAGDFIGGVKNAGAGDIIEVTYTLNAASS